MTRVVNVASYLHGAVTFEELWHGSILDFIRVEKAVAESKARDQIENLSALSLLFGGKETDEAKERLFKTAKGEIWADQANRAAIIARFKASK